MFDPSFQTLALEILRFAGVCPYINAKNGCISTSSLCNCSTNVLFTSFQIRPWTNFEQRIQTTFVSATIPHELLKLLQNLIQVRFHR